MREAMQERTALEESLIAGAAALDATGAVGTPALDAARAEARVRLEAGLPTRRDEAWKYTDLRKLLREGYRPAPTEVEAAPKDAFAALEAIEIALVNGAPRGLKNLAPVAGLRILGFAEALATAPELVQEFYQRPAPGAVFDMNAALSGDGVVIEIAEGVKLNRPIKLCYGAAAADGAAYHMTVLVKLGAGAGAMLLETYSGADEARYLANGVAHIRLGAGAELRRVSVQAEGACAAHLAGDTVRLAARARYDSYLFSTGAALSRRDIRLAFDGPGGAAHLSGASLMRGRQHGDVTLMIDHASPDCMSTERFRSVLDEAARGVFQGKVLVRREGRGTDAQMRARALLLSGAAEADAKPELEIYADKVVCAHGATMGALDREALFYLRSRGIAAPAARALLIEAFVRETASAIADEATRDAIEAGVANWLNQERPDRGEAS